MDRNKYSKIKEEFEKLETKKNSLDLLSALETVLAEATETDGNVKITIDRNKQGLSIPATLLTDYITARKTEIDDEIVALTDKFDVK